MTSASNATSLSVTQLTPEGRGAVATLSIHGELTILDACFQAANKKTIAALAVNQIAYGTWESPTQPAEDVVFVKLAADVAEVHCHGGAAAVSRIIADIQSLGGEERERPPGSAPLVDECQQALLCCTTTRTAKLVLQQSQRLPLEIARWLTLSPTEILPRIDEMLTWSDFGERLTLPRRVVLCGEPNVGKSSLLNALVGYSRSVVFDQPGTTRDAVTAATAIRGWPVEFCDTAGLRDTLDQLEAQGVELARQQLQGADLILHVFDITQPFTIPQELRKLNPVIQVGNKCDLMESPDITPDAVLPVSARTGWGVDTLLDVIATHVHPALPPAAALYPVSTVQTEQLRSLHAAISTVLNDGHEQQLPAAIDRQLRNWLGQNSE